MQVLIGKVAQTVEVDFDSLPKVSQEYIINYGLKQVLNDCHASISLKAVDKAGLLMYPDSEAVGRATMEAVREKLAALQSGDISIRQAGQVREALDPIVKVSREIAWDDYVKPSLVKKGIKLNTVKAEDRARFVSQVIEKYADDIIPEAKRRVKKAASIEIDFEIS